MNAFDPIPHVYTMDGVRVPSVTQIVNHFCPPFQADQFYLDKGSAVHAALAMIALGIEFDPVDERIAGKVEAGRRFFRDCKPTVGHVEKHLFSAHFRFAGTLDLSARIDGHIVIIDWKSRLTKSVQWQLGGYAALLKEETGLDAKRGYGVQLNDDGRYQVGETYDLIRSGREFLGMFGNYNALKREGFI